MELEIISFLFRLYTRYYLSSFIYLCCRWRHVAFCDPFCIVQRFCIRYMSRLMSRICVSSFRVFFLVVPGWRRWLDFDRRFRLFHLRMEQSFEVGCLRPQNCSSYAGYARSVFDFLVFSLRTTSRKVYPPLSLPGRSCLQSHGRSTMAFGQIHYFRGRFLTGLYLIRYFPFVRFQFLLLDFSRRCDRDFLQYGSVFRRLSIVRFHRHWHPRRGAVELVVVWVVVCRARGAHRRGGSPRRWGWKKTSVSCWTARRGEVSGRAR